MAQLSRPVRIARFLRAWPRHLMNKYPEQFFGYLFLGIPALAMWSYRTYNCGIDGQKPWYRGIYDVRRVDDPTALNWRLPEEYPAGYQSNRESYTHWTAAKDYGWKAKLD
ncbi:Protein K12H4.5 [Aphelenchoides avenae]|nr:Protein K12H4.5 [Aphelenchus avenae]KAH7727980.1 Protein K12H4.5 [Aphelenchus avenae]